MKIAKCRNASTLARMSFFAFSMAKWSEARPAVSKNIFEFVKQIVNDRHLIDVINRVVA